MQLDEHLLLYLNHLGSARWDGFWSFVTAACSWIPLYVLIVSLSIWKLGWRRGGFAVLFALLLFGFTDQLADLIKLAVGRLRPCHDPQIATAVRLIKGHCGGKYGFTSGHAGNSFAFATFMIRVFSGLSKWAYLLLLWAAMVSYSRIYVGVHFPLDILAGALLGALSGFVFYRLYRLFVRRFDKQLTSRG